MKLSKKLLGLACALVLASGSVFVVAGCSSSGSDDAAQSAQSQNAEGATGDMEAAKALVDKTATKDEIETQVGKPYKFEMNSEGCERGVYAGYFYYDNFSIFSVTYDKGQTFTVKTISE